MLLFWGRGSFFLSAALLIFSLAPKVNSTRIDGWGPLNNVGTGPWVASLNDVALDPGRMHGWASYADVGLSGSSKKIKKVVAYSPTAAVGTSARMSEAVHAAITDDGKVWFWGTIQQSTWMFRIAMNTLQTTWVPVSPTYPPWNDFAFEDVALSYHAIALVSTEYKLYTVGWNNFLNFTSLLGRPYLITDTPVHPWPFAVALNAPMDTWLFKRVFGSTWNFFALSSKGTLVGWGLNLNGMLAQDPVSVTHAGPPVQIVLSEVAVELAASTSHVLVATGDGNVYAWGLGTSGELGVDPATLPGVGYRYQPQKIASLSSIVAVLADEGRSAAINSTGALFIFGTFDSYLFGSPTSWAPFVFLFTVPDYKIRGGCMRKSSLTSSMRFLMIGVNRTASELFGAGDNYDGELLLAGQSTRVASLTRAAALSEVAGKTIVQVACSDESTVVLTGDGLAYTWTDRSTDLANRELSLRSVPGLIDNMSDYPSPTSIDSRALKSTTGSVLKHAGVKKVSARHVIAMITDETQSSSPLVFWGQNPPQGIFGANSVVRRVGFAEAPSSQNWIDVSVGNDRAFFLHESGELWWTGPFSSASAADGTVSISKYGNGLVSLKWIIALYDSEIGVTADGDIWTLRQLKNTETGEVLHSSTPELVSPASSWKAGYSSPIKHIQGNWYIIDGNDTNPYWSVYILLENGTMFGFGSNAFGQLCQELPGVVYFTEIPTVLPVPPQSGNGQPYAATSFSAGGAFIVALFNDTMTTVNAYACGANHKNQMGLVIPYYDDSKASRPPIYRPEWNWVRLWWLWESDGGSMPVQVTTSSENTYMLTNKGRIWQWGSDSFIRSTTGIINANAAVPQVGVTMTRKFSRLFASFSSVFAQTTVIVETFPQPCGTGVNSVVELAKTSTTTIKVAGWGFGTLMSDVKVTLTLSNSSIVDCTPLSLEMDSSAANSDTRKRVITCAVDLTDAPLGPLTGVVSVSNEDSDPFNAGTVVPAPIISPPVGSSPYADSAKSFNISGSNFGTCSSTLTVTFNQDGVNTPCVVKQASDARISCDTTADLVAGKVVTVSVARLGISASYTGFPVVVPSPIVYANSTVYPNNINVVNITGQNFGSSPSVVTSGVPCSILSKSDSFISCSLDSAKFGNYSGYVDAVVYAWGGSSGTPVTVATMTFPPKAASVDAGSVASGADEVSIRGIRFGSLTEVSVNLIIDNTTKRAEVSIPCQVLSITVDDTTLSGEETLKCRPQSALASMSAGTVKAQVTRNGGTSSLAVLGRLVPNPTILSSSPPTLGRTISVVDIVGDHFAAYPDHLNNAVALSNTTCRILNATSTRITCAIVAPVNGTQLLANVRVYGASTGFQLVAYLVDPPKVIFSDAVIPPQSTSLTVAGQNFAGASSTVQIFLNARLAACAPQPGSTSIQITCTVDETVLSDVGSIFAIVGSFGVFSDKIQIGVVKTTSAGNGVSGPGTFGTKEIVGIVVAAVAFVVVVAAVTLLIVRRYKHIQDIKLRDAALKISEEAKGLFNIKASDITVISKLGEGSFGAVYLGKYRGAHVAIKRLATNVLGSQINDFFREAAVMLSQKRHRNVVHCIGMCQEQANFSMVMEFLPNGSLLDLSLGTLEQTGRVLNDRVLWKVLRGVACGMAALASQGIVHRDLAARNVLLDAELEARVSDFGFSRNLGDQEQGKTSSSVGPVKWMSPESLGTRVYSEKSDVWSFGCLIYEVVTGTAPFRDEDLLAVAVRVRDSGINTLDAYPPQNKFPSYLDQIMRVCFNVDPANRPTFETLVQIFDEKVPAGMIAPRGQGWQVDDVIAGLQPPRERKAGKGESSNEMSVWDSESDSEYGKPKVKTNYVETNL